MKTKLKGAFWRIISMLPITGDIFWWYIQRKSKSEDKLSRADK